jgi:bisphosphoglycerate-dependent phosphoglycerate mutase
MRQFKYEYDIVQGLSKKVIDRAFTRRKAREIKKDFDEKEPNVTHRIVQHRYALQVTQNIS